MQSAWPICCQRSARNMPTDRGHRRLRQSGGGARGTTLSRHVLAELDKLELPRVETTMSEAVAYGEIGFSGTVLKDGAAAEEITALTAELQAAGALP
jgi:hypothetical protein